MTEIIPNALYSSEELVGIFGRRALVTCRQQGLYAVSGLYLGQRVLETFALAGLAAASRRKRDAKEGQRVDPHPVAPVRSYAARPQRRSDLPAAAPESQLEIYQRYMKEAEKQEAKDSYNPRKTYQP